MAATTILWVQERYDPDKGSLPELLQVAEKWNAAVSLVRLIANDQADSPGLEEPEDEESASVPPQSPAEHAGILDDDEREEELGRRWYGFDDGSVDPSGMRRGTCDGTGLATSAGSASGSDSAAELGGHWWTSFLSKSESVRKRQTRELAAYVGESLRVPVIGAEDLKTQYLFGPTQWLRLLVYLGVTVLLFAAVMTNQEPILSFLTREGLQHRLLAIAALVLFVPSFAYLWGQSAHYLLRLVKFE